MGGGGGQVAPLAPRGDATARQLQNFCSRYGPAPTIHVVEDLSQHSFLEGSVLTASAGARSGS